MDKAYLHSDHEDGIYQKWEKLGFSPTSDPKAEPFTIIMPPPNANDPLHVGHAMFIALEDIMIRTARMQGKAALWVPGTDHAGIETQFVFEKKLAKEGKSRFDFDRETLYKMIWDYVQENSGVAVGQMKKLGASADWSRFKFMLEPEIVSNVIETFVKLDNEGLVYRDLRLVNYCTKCGTAYSELEVDHTEQNSPLYYVKYRFADNPEKHVVIATTRPEPIFVDTHVAVHPDNPKTKDLIGKKLLNPLTDREMTVIADEFVDMEFGTGIVKLTPAHDMTDFEVAKKHNLPIVEAINIRGKIVESAPMYAGLSVADARKQAVADLEAKGLIEKIDDKYVNRVGTCYRCGRVLEPLPMPQFYVKVKPLTEPILKALKEKKLKVYGSGHDKILKHWLTNLRDWNISRQIVWGIRIPVWYKISTNLKVKSENYIEVKFLSESGELVNGQLNELLEKYNLGEISKGLQNINVPIGTEYVVSVTQPGDDYLQETDTFDTWFSSAQWPFTTLKNTQPGDFERFYPTTVMETGYDILPFWVMRMLMVGNFATGKLPFEKVYLHGLVRDTKGQKMSKSKGNVINPLAVIEKYGADALRMALVIRSSAGTDKNVGEQDFRAMRNFTNKIWNATRFIIVNLENSKSQIPNHKQIQNDNKLNTKQDNAFHEKLNQVITDVTRNIEEMRIGLAAETVYNEFWHWYCDESIENNKQGLVSDEALLKGLAVFLKLLHPFVPFVTESVWEELSNKKILGGEENKVLMFSKWPTTN